MTLYRRAGCPRKSNPTVTLPPSGLVTVHSPLHGSPSAVTRLTGSGTSFAQGRRNGAAARSVRPPAHALWTC
eukprot:scaffold1439_cov404-Prasinococcus_capsulatus_cf.AAC.53